MFEQSTLGLVQPCLGACNYYIRYITSLTRKSPGYILRSKNRTPMSA